MSELTSSTEVDGASSGLSVATCNSHVEATPRPETTILEQTEVEDNPDSITHDYVHVSVPINADLDELRSETNQPSLFAGYLEQYAEYIPSLQIVTNVLPAWLLQSSENVGASSASPETSVDAHSFESWVTEAIHGDYTGSVEDEQRFRTCLVRAMSDNFERLHRVENTLFAENCTVTEEELCYAHSSESQYTRRLLLMLLHRDTQTMLAFIHRMTASNSDAVERILASLHRYLGDSNVAHQVQCLRCVLRERVNISLVTDHLPQCSSDLLTFVNTVSEEDQPGRPSNSERLWNELFEIVNNTDLYSAVIRTIARAVELCGYHTDVIRMIQSNANLERNSFVCTCEAMRLDETRHSHNSDETTKESTHAQSADKTCDATQPEGDQADVPFKDEADSSHKLCSVNESEQSKNQSFKCANKEDNSDCVGVEDSSQSANERVKLNRANYKRKPEDSTLKDDDKKRNKDEPDLSEYQKIVYTNINSSKRKERPSGSATEERKRRKEYREDHNRRSSIGNCDLQIELMKIAGRENPPDSGFSFLLPSTSSFGDSGFHEQSAALSRGSNDETVPKQIVPVININANSERQDTIDDMRSTESQEEENSDRDTYVPLDHSTIEHGELDSSPDNVDEKQDASNL